MAWFSDLDSTIAAFVLAVLMLAGWYLGFRRGKHLSEYDREELETTFSDASLGLLGLILAFTFSMSLTKHENRRLMVVADSNAVGDFYTCVSLLKDPVRGKLQSLLREYAKARIAIADHMPTPEELDKALVKFQADHNKMQELVGEAVDQGTPVVVPLVNTLNELTSSHASRLSAARDRLPPTVVVLLFLSAIVTMSLMGKHQGAAAKPRVVATLGFVMVVCMLVWVTLDLNQPARGAITVSQEPMQRVLMGMQ